MGALGNIRAALETDLLSVSGIPTLGNWSVDNGPQYKPVEGTPWIRVQVQQTSRRPANRGSNPSYRREGVFIVSIMWPKGLGSGDAETLADAIQSRYGVGEVKTSGGQNVRFDYSEAGEPDGDLDPAWYLLPVVTAWYTYEAP